MSSNPFGLPYCSECGEARVPHGMYKFQAWVNVMLERFEERTHFLGESSYPIFVRWGLDRYVPIFLETLAWLRLGTLKSEVDPRDNIRTKALFDGAKAAGVHLRQFRLLNVGDNGTFIAEKGDKVLTFAVMPRPRGFRSPSLNWMDDKGKLKIYLLKHHIPTAEGGVASTLAEANAIYDRIGPPVISKPHRTSRGLHTTIEIRSKQDLERAFRITKQVSPWAIIEKELQGIVHRVTLVGGRVSAIVKRDYPSVYGDGVSTVRQLLDKENSDPRRDDFEFYKIQPNDRAEYQLSHNGLSWDSVPAKGQHVILNDKVSRRHGTVTVDVTDETHPENIKLFERIAEVMGDPLIGVDYMIGDMSVPWQEQPGNGLIECNSMPYIDLHHYPYEGKARNVGKDLWDYVFAHSA